MKQKMKRHYRSAISIVLSVCMLVSCMTVGLIATDAARLTGDDSVGDNSYTPTGYWVGKGNDQPQSGNGEWVTVGTQSGTVYSTEYTCASKADYYFYLVGPDSGGYNDKNIWTSEPNIDRSQASSVITVSNSGNQSGSYYARIYCSVAGTKINISYNTSTRTFTVTLPAVTLTLDATGIASYSSTATVSVSGSADMSASSGTTSASYIVGETATMTVDPLSDTSKKPTASLGGSAVSLTFNGTKYTGTFQIPSSSSTLTIGSASKSSYSVVAANTDGLGTVYPSTAQTYMEGDAVTLTAVPTGNNYFKNWSGTVYSSTDNPATYYVNGNDATGDTITITGNFGTNHYTATAGDSLRPANIFTGISATFFDYYYDHEVQDHWLSFSGENNDINPYKTLNTALDQYARDTTGSRSEVPIPLYFGNFYNSAPSNESTGYFTSYKNWFGPPNNSDRLRSFYSGTDVHYAVTGLSGTKISNDHKTIYHFDNSVASTNNGVPMALFDEDWLTSRDTYTEGGTVKDYSYKGALATIIDSPFPVVKTENYRLYFTKPSGWSGDINAYFYDSAATWTSWPGNQLTQLSGDLYYLDIPTDKIGQVKGKNVIFSASNDRTNNRKETTVGSSGSKDWYDGTASEWTQKGDFTQTHAYYGFNSTNGQDNAYFKGLNNGSPTNLTMEYGAGEAYAVKDNQSDGRGCFPFDGEELGGKNTQAEDYGFGVRMDIPFTLGQNGKLNGINQTFDFSGDDDLWVFVDGELVLDLGGAHGKTTGSIDFGYATDQAKITVEKTVGNTQYPSGNISAVERNHSTTSGVFAFTNSGADVEITKHTMTLFYLERGMGESNLKFGYTFTPVSNEFMTEKNLETDSVNDALKADVETAVEGDKFNFSNQWSASTSNVDFSNLPSGKKYTLQSADGTKTSKTTDGTGTLPNDGEWFSIGDRTEFIGQFTVGQYFKISENDPNPGTSGYTYTPSLEVKDLVTGQSITEESGAYKFQTTKATDPATSAYYDASTDPTRILASVTNSIATQNVAITKAIADTSAGAPGDFTISVRVKLPGESDYALYPLTYSTATGLGTLTVNAGDGTATATIHNGETITVLGIPVGSTVEVTETAGDGTYSYASSSVTGVDTSAGVTNGKNFVVKNGSDATVTINNSSTPVVTTKALTITKRLAEYTESDPFTVKIETSANGSDWTDFASQAYTSTGTAGATDANGKAEILQDETITFAAVELGTYVRITETGFVKDYIFDSASAKKHADPTADADNLASVANGCTFRMVGDDVDVTINNARRTYKWIVKSEYTSRLWSTQGYTADGTFTNAQLDYYTEYAQVKDEATGNTVLGIKFKNSALRGEFVAHYLPYEDNFRTGVTWKLNESSENYYDTAGIISMGVTAEYQDVDKLTAIYKFPCKMSHVPTGSAPTDTIDGHAVVDGESATSLSVNKNVSYMNWYCLNDAKLDGGIPTKDPIFVSAPLSIIDKTDGDKIKYFKYWVVKVIDPETGVTGKEYTRCYNREYNLAFYQSSVIEPYYEEADAPFDHTKVSEEDNARYPARITWLENSRNQWNGNEPGRARYVWDGEGNNSHYGDRVFMDFVLDFHYVENGINVQLNTIPEAQRSKYHAGLLIQQLGELEKSTEPGEVYKTSNAYYNDMYDTEKHPTVNDGKTAAMNALIDGTATKASGYFNSAISVDKFDNKNELEYFYHFANISQSADYRQRTEYKYHLYRAYTYLYVDGGQQIISDPVYFTIYDIASIENDYERAISGELEPLTPASGGSGTATITDPDNP